MNRIKQLREEIGMTQVRLSIELEVSQETISAYEHDKHYPSISSLLKMMRIFNVSADYIMGFSDVRKPVKSLKDDEEMMLGYYKNLCKRNKETALAYLQGLSNGQQNMENSIEGT